MSYPALPDRRMPYDNDGTAVVSTSTNQSYTVGATTYPTGTEKIALNGLAAMTASAYAPLNGVQHMGLWFFFPEQREVTGLFVGLTLTPQPGWSNFVEGSNDTTNGLDGSWETASSPGGTPYQTVSQIDLWRSSIKAVSFTGGKRTLRLRAESEGGIGSTPQWYTVIHLYGEKAAGQTPNDLIYIDHDTTPGVEYTADEDFGDRPLGTSVVRQFRVKNVSPTLTANTINLQCNDADFALSTDGITWVVTINIASLAAGAESATMYIRDTTPNPGAALGPRFARIVATVGSWS